jgi:DNA-binding transcriptional regulator YiaG
MKVAFGETLLEAAKTSSQERKKLVRRWENTVKVLIEKGWQVKPDTETYPPEYWSELMTTNPLNQIPDDPEIAAKFWAADATQAEGSRITDITKRTRGSFERLLNGRLWIQTPKEIAEKLNNIAQSKKVDRSKPVGQKSVKPRSKKPTNQPQQSDINLELTGEQVKEIRIAKGLSVTKLAELTGMGKSTISMIETGKRNITDETRKRLREALGII